MSDKNIEMMKKLLEAKKQQNSKPGTTLRPNKNIGSKRKGVKNNKQGGLFD